MGAIAMILGIISLVALLILLIPLPLTITLSGVVIYLAVVSASSVVGLILGIVDLVKSEPNKRLIVL
jgi:hypothetical protein